MPGPDLTPDEQIIFNEFRVSIGRVFQPLYDNWDDDKWDKAVGAQPSCFFHITLLTSIGFYSRI
jgi:hypothetical protein